MITISIITVTYNASKLIKNTIESVLNQNSNQMEYLILDGNSGDRTVLIAKSYTERFDEKGVSYRVISKKDNGIYDAMNHAAGLAVGEYILYLNAGDCIVEKDTIKRISHILDKKRPDICYGDTILIKNGYGKLMKACEEQFLEKKIGFCHQSAFIESDLMRRYKYDLSFEVCADRDFFTRCVVQKKFFLYVNIPVSVYLLGGYSSKNASKQMKMEENEIMYKYGFTTSEIYNKKKKRIVFFHKWVKVYEVLKECLYSLFPFIYKIRGWKKIRNK